MSDATFNALIIVESLTRWDRKTGRLLHDDLNNLITPLNESPSLGYSFCQNYDQLRVCFSELLNIVVSSGIRPIVHFEVHGNEKGIGLADGSFVYWAELRQLLSPVNVATHMNLLVVFAACHGGTFISSVDLSERAPFWGVIGPTRKLTELEIEQDFGAFYRSLFQTLSPREAIEALNGPIGQELYYRTHAKKLFYDSWDVYKGTQFTDDVLKVRAGRLSAMLSINLTAEECRELLSSCEEASFNRYRNIFFMYDLFPEHEERFGVTYEEGESRNSH